MNRVFDRLTSLAACLCAQIRADGSPEPCFCGVIPGDGAVAEYAGDCETENGMAWVRLIGMYPAEGVGVESLTAGNCSAGLDAMVEIGMLRWAALPDERGNPPSASALLDSADLVTTDALTMMRAVACCPDLSSKDYILGAYTPIGPLGGLVGGVWRVTIAVA